MKKKIVLGILFCIFTLTIPLYCQEFTHKTYWLTEEKYYSPVSQENVIFLTEENAGIRTHVYLLKYGRGSAEFIELASVEVNAPFPGVMEIEVLIAEVKKVAGSIGGNMIELTNALTYKSSTKISDVSARVYRIQFRKDERVLSSNMISNLSLLDGTDETKIFQQDFIKGIKNYDKYGDERDGIFVLSETKFSKLLDESRDNLLGSLIEKYKEKDKNGFMKGFSNLSETEIKLYFQKYNESILKLKEEYPQEYEEYNNIHKQYFNKTLEEKTNEHEKSVLSKRKTSNPVNKN